MKFFTVQNNGKWENSLFKKKNLLFLKEYKSFYLVIVTVLNSFTNLLNQVNCEKKNRGKEKKICRKENKAKLRRKKFLIRNCASPNYNYKDKLLETQRK